jgi:hypothetical protein
VSLSYLSITERRPFWERGVVECLLDRNNDAHDQAIFVEVVVYLGDDTVYVWSSSSRR